MAFSYLNLERFLAYIVQTTGSSGSGIPALLGACVIRALSFTRNWTSKLLQKPRSGGNTNLRETE